MADRLWDKALPLDEMVHQFTVGDDPEIDLEIMPYDIVGSAAHAIMLEKIGVLTSLERIELVRDLRELWEQAEVWALSISREQEDCHTALEALLTQRSEAGKKIHTGRSRNDQVTTAVRLWMRDALMGVTDKTLELAEIMLTFAREHESDFLPGYTHWRQAMPSSFGQWAGAYAEGLFEECEAAEGLWNRIDKNPLGGAAGFGVPLALDRDYTAELLGFTQVHVSPIDVQNSRGRHEAAFGHWLSSIGRTLEQLAWDLMLYSTEEFGYVRIPDEFTTGSSIMPQKRNPDVLELMRGRCRELRGTAATLDMIGSGLTSSYHRDYQFLKKPIIGMANQSAILLAIMARVVVKLDIRPDAARDRVSNDLWATQAAYDLASSGVPFREAYRTTAQRVIGGALEHPGEQQATHLGGLGDLGLERLAERAQAARTKLNEREQKLKMTMDHLWSFVN
ncbi:MAG: argininosuccinate lyase [Armatimonadetes bacterium]|nr:argininosuccinate lyase [Armatimonadota bacterium]